MSAAAEKHIAPEASDAKEAANNNRYFTHGGIGGILEETLRAVKGITIDAAMDVLEEPANNNDHLAKAAHAKGEHAGEAAAEGADVAHAQGGIGAAVKAALKEHENADFTDRVVMGLEHMVPYGYTFAVLAKALPWLRNQFFPKIELIKTDDQHIGDQILNQLARDKKKEKKGEVALTKPALEGFLQGLKPDNVRRSLRMFQDADRFERALKTEAGREEIKKEIANLLDLSGDVDRLEVEETTDHLLKLIDADVDGRLVSKKLALRKIIEKAKALLTQENLIKVYTGKSEKFEIDYDEFGDVLLEKVEPEQRVPFLKTFNGRNFDDTFRLLVKESALKDALRDNKEELKNQIYQLFDMRGRIKNDELDERMKHFFGDDSVLGKEDDYSDPAMKKKYNEVRAKLDGVVNNLKSTGALNKLFHSDETDPHYSEFGKTLDGIEDGHDLNALLRGFSHRAFAKAFRLLLDKARLDTVIKGSDHQRQAAQVQLLALLGFDSGPLDQAEVVKTITDFETNLNGMEADVETSLKGSPDKPYEQLLDDLGAIKIVLEDKTKDRVKGIFEGEKVSVNVNHNAVGKQILNEISKDKRKVVPFLLDLQVALLTAKFAVLQNSTFSDKDLKRKAKAALINLFGIKPGEIIHEPEVEARINALLAPLRTHQISANPQAQVSYREFENLLNNIRKQLTAARLAEIYG